MSHLGGKSLIFFFIQTDILSHIVDVFGTVVYEQTLLPDPTI